MPEIEVEKTKVHSADKTLDSEITIAQDQDDAKTENSLAKPAPGRLPARAWRS
jgi:hypothetical protein